MGPIRHVVLLHAAAAALSAQVQWRTESGPGPVTIGVAYDARRAELVALGFDDTWVHDGNRWQRRTSPATLRNRTETIMAYDEGAGAVLLFGGRIGGNAVGETWRWDGASWILVHSDPRLASVEGYMTFDVGRGRLVRHGMDNGIWRMWDWDGTTWSQLGTSLATLSGLTYDRANGRLLGLAFDRLYEWTGAAWTALPGVVLPSPGLARYRLAYDRARQELLVFAGGPNDVRVWRWTGTAFAQVTTASSPPGRTHFALAFDTSSQRLVLHGGGDSEYFGRRTDTWDWDGTQWTIRESPPVLPLSMAPRNVANVAYDAARDRVAVFQSGSSGEGGMREWDGQRWHRAADLQIVPPTANGPLVYDSLRQRLVLVTSGASSTVQTWTFDGSVWSQIATSNAPPNRPNLELAYDAARDRIVMFGGGLPITNETWLFDGADWSQVFPATSPPATTTSRMVYDPVHQQCVLFRDGAQTWTWDGVTWSLRATPAAMTPRVGYAMAWDPARQRVVLTGGASAYQPSGWVLHPPYLWEWDGTAWSARTTSGLPQTLNAALVGTADSLVLVGGGQPQVTSALRRLVAAPLATAVGYGAGCTGSHGVPLLDADFVPYLGHTGFAVRLTSAPAQTLAAVAFGLASASVALGGGCTQLVGGGLAVHVGVTDPGGAVRFPLAIPPDPAFVGVRIRGQGAALDAGGALGGVSLSAGVDLVLGR